MSLESAQNPVLVYDADGNPIVLGQATMANSLPVAIASNQTAIPVTDNGGSLTVDVASLPLPTGAATETTLSALNTNAADIETILTAIRDTAGVKKITDALPAGTNNIGDVDVVSSALPTGAATETTLATRAAEHTTAASPHATRLSDGAAFYKATTPADTQPVSAVSLPLPAGAATETTLAALNTNAADIETILAAIEVILTAIRDTAGIKKITDALPAGTNNIGDVDVVSSALPTGAATESTLASINTKTLAAGQADMAASSPVVLASDQSAVASKNDAASQVDGHSASIGATADADTALTMIGRLKKIVALLAGGLPASLVGGRLDNNIGAWLGSTVPTIGQKTMAASIPVVFPSDQTIAVTTSPTTATPSLAFGDVALAAITTAALYRTAYTEQSANFTGSIASSNAADTAAGTGARTVRIYYVNATGATAGTEDVTLNGVAFVNLVTATKCFIEKIEVLTVGSSGSNTGILTLKTGAAGAGTTVCTIGATDNRTFLAHHYVVTGKTANVTGVLIGSNVTNTAGSCIGFLRATIIGAANAVEKQISDGVTVAGLDSSVFRSYGSQIQVVGPARITLYVTTATGSAFNYRGSFDSYDV